MAVLPGLCLSAKRCPLCGETKPPAEYHKGASLCKPCACARARESYARNREKIAAIAMTEEARRHANALRRARYAENPERVKARNAAWKAANPSKVVERYKRWYQAGGKQQAVRNAAAWNNRNVDYTRARVSARRSRVKQATPKWADMWMIQEAYTLAALRTKLTGCEWQVDHVIPLHGEVVCGLHVIDNLRVVTAAENNAKGNTFGGV